MYASQIFQLLLAVLNQDRARSGIREFPQVNTCNTYISTAIVNTYIHVTDTCQTLDMCGQGGDSPGKSTGGLGVFFRG